jgi:hypothetical protein
MHCPHCGVEHEENTPCKPASQTKPEPRRTDEHPLAGLDNPFWKPEKPAAASL